MYHFVRGLGSRRFRSYSAAVILARIVYALSICPCNGILLSLLALIDVYFCFVQSVLLLLNIYIYSSTHSRKTAIALHQ